MNPNYNQQQQQQQQQPQFAPLTMNNLQRHNSFTLGSTMPMGGNMGYHQHQQHVQQQMHHQQQQQQQMHHVPDGHMNNNFQFQVPAFPQHHQQQQHMSQQQHQQQFQQQQQQQQQPRTLNRHQSFAFGSSPQDFGLGPTPVFSFPTQHLNFAFNQQQQGGVAVGVGGQPGQSQGGVGYPVPPNTPTARVGAQYGYGQQQQHQQQLYPQAPQLQAPPSIQNPQQQQQGTNTLEKKLSFSLPLSLPSPATQTLTSRSLSQANMTSPYPTVNSDASPSLINGFQRFAFSQSFDQHQQQQQQQQQGVRVQGGEASPFANSSGKKHSFDEDFGPLIDGGDDIDFDDDDDFSKAIVSLTDNNISQHRIMANMQSPGGSSSVNTNNNPNFQRSNSNLSSLHTHEEESQEDEEAEMREIMMYQKQALEILSKCNPKPIIAMDLDYTIWPLYCFEHTLPPYRRSVGRDVNSPKDSAEVKELIYCICRKTNTLRSIALYPQVKSVLEFCADNNIVLTICSRSPNVGVVEQILTQFGLWDWFLFPQIYNARKSYHFRNLSDATGLNMKDFLFFDDELSNLNVVSKLGVYCCQVDKEEGLNWPTFLKGITMFYAKQRASNSLKRWLSTTTTNPVPNGNSQGQETAGSASPASSSTGTSNQHSMIQANMMMMSAPSTDSDIPHHHDKFATGAAMIGIGSSNSDGTEGEMMKTVVDLLACSTSCSHDSDIIYSRDHEEVEEETKRKQREKIIEHELALERQRERERELGMLNIGSINDGSLSGSGSKEIVKERSRDDQDNSSNSQALPTPRRRQSLGGAGGPSNSQTTGSSNIQGSLQRTGLSSYNLLEEREKEREREREREREANESNNKLTMDINNLQRTLSHPTFIEA